MSAKFFTWTKGDRRNATEALRANGVVPIPVECITIKGMDYGRNAKGSSKASRKPLPLTFDQSPAPSSKHSSRTTESIAFQDAALQSATNLMAVMNDMLRSPQLSAHLQQRSAGFTPSYGRPRSHTVPSTPIAEAPHMDPVELPGSLVEARSAMALSLHGKEDSKARHQSTRSSNQALYGAMIERPHSSPQEPTNNQYSFGGQSTEDVSRIALTYPPALLSPRRTHGDLRQSATAGFKSPSISSKIQSHDSYSTSSSITKRPSLAPLQKWRSKSPSVSGYVATSQPGSTSAVPPFRPSSANSTATNAEHHHPFDGEAVLMEQISLMRASHDVHVSSLKDAHEREIESHRSYIEFLERRNNMPGLQPQASKQSLTIDTSHGGARAADRASLDNSATTLQSFESSLENRKRSSQDSVAEVESLKRKLSIARKAQVESSELRRERDELRVANDRCNRRILQLKNIVQKAKDNEKSLKAATTDLEARLELANVERIDTLEGFHDACGELRKSAKREQELVQQLESCKAQVAPLNVPNVSENPETRKYAVRRRHGRALSDVSGLNLAKQIPGHLLSVPTDTLRPDSSRDAGSDGFEQEQTAQLSSKVGELELALKKQKELLDASQKDCDRYNSLLHNELRRQSRTSVLKTPSFGSNIDAEAMAAAKEMTRAAIESSNSEPVDSGAATTVLEKELEHCLKEIIMYKLDIRGYKKDIRKVTAQLDDLRAVNIQRPPTPESQSSVRSPSHPDKSRNPSFEAPRHGTPDSGLGISVPHTPSHTMASATMTALLQSTPSMVPETFHPLPRPKTPLGTHKKLPRPPPASRTPSPLPGAPSTPKLQRGETMRSLSESIISSYAQRSTPEQASGLTPPPRDVRRLKSSEASPAAVSKFTSNLLRMTVQQQPTQGEGRASI